MKKIKLFGILGVLALLGSGCSNYTYYAIGGKNANLSKYHCFAWLPPVDTTTSAGYNDLADQRIKDEATDQLQKKGLVLNPRRPDLLVRYSIMFKDRVHVYDDPQYTYMGGGFYPRMSRWGNIYYRYSTPYQVYVGDEIERVPYKQGTVLIDLIDRNTRHVVWRGYAVGEMDTQSQSLKDLPEVVDGIIRKLPLTAMQ